MSVKHSRTLFFFYLVVSLSVVMAIAVIGCGQKETNQTKVTKPQTIRITGSSTCLPLLRILTGEYSKTHPNIRFLYLPGAHSPAGIEGAAKGTLDIGAVSRDLKPEEAALGLEYIELSSDGLALATHNSITIESLTAKQVREVYSGELNNWSFLGGADVSIFVLDRAEDESAKVILRQYVLEDIVVSQSASVMFLETDMIKALENTPNSIGYCSLGAIISDKLPINLIALDGVKPSVATIQDGSYKMVRPMGIVLKKNPSPATRAFADWAKGKEAAKIMDAKGYASIK